MARLQLGRSAVYDLLRTRQLASITLGRSRRIPAHALTDFIRTRQNRKPPPDDRAPRHPRLPAYPRQR
ncbi:excisionase family DNA binding protein [Streptomyces sp. VMFN-G11Ma]|jgi:excisionase family DNA binding protein|nr:excisionase family DNA binding protein [Streptomyces sp. VMFN-G11Ma]